MDITQAANFVGTRVAPFVTIAAGTEFTIFGGVVSVGVHGGAVEGAMVGIGVIDGCRGSVLLLFGIGASAVGMGGRWGWGQSVLFVEAGLFAALLTPFGTGAVILGSSGRGRGGCRSGSR
jgi:hypothetical protein